MKIITECKIWIRINKTEVIKLIEEKVREITNNWMKTESNQLKLELNVNDYKNIRNFQNLNQNVIKSPKNNVFCLIKQ